MNFKFLLYSFLCLIIVFFYYKIHLYWLNKVKENKKAFFIPMIYIRSIGDWIVIVGISITGIFFLLKFIF